MALLDMALLDRALLLVTLLDRALLDTPLRARSGSVNVPTRLPSALKQGSPLHVPLLDRTLLDGALLDVRTTQQSVAHQSPMNDAFLDSSLLLAALLDVRTALLNRGARLLDVALLDMTFLDVALLDCASLHPGVATSHCAEQRRRTYFGSGHKQTGDQQGRYYKTTFHFP